MAVLLALAGVSRFSRREFRNREAGISDTGMVNPGIASVGANSGIVRRGLVTSKETGLASASVGANSGIVRRINVVSLIPPVAASFSRREFRNREAADGRFGESNFISCFSRREFRNREAGITLRRVAQINRFSRREFRNREAVACRLTLTIIIVVLQSARIQES